MTKEPTNWEAAYNNERRASKLLAHSLSEADKALAAMTAERDAKEAECGRLVARNGLLEYSNKALDDERNPNIDGSLAFFLAKSNARYNDSVNKVSAIESSVVGTVGGVDFEGNPTNSINYLQRLRILLAAEAQRDKLQAKVALTAKDNEAKFRLLYAELDAVRKERDAAIRQGANWEKSTHAMEAKRDTAQARNAELERAIRDNMIRPIFGNRGRGEAAPLIGYRCECCNNECQPDGQIKHEDCWMHDALLSPQAEQKPVCPKCGGKGWIFKGHGNDEQCDCIFVEPPNDAPCTSCGKPRSVLRKSLSDHLCNACRAQESE